MIYQLIDLINPSNYENETEFWQKVWRSIESCKMMLSKSHHHQMLRNPDSRRGVVLGNQRYLKQS